MLIFVGFLAVGLAALRTVPDVACPVVTTVFALQLVAWILAPLVAFGVDETVDPTRFALAADPAADPATRSAGDVVDRLFRRC